ncbi:MAG: twin-arginine translocase subunit TatC [Deferribacteres bacterium]|nr:twin-arginine translocase subunit TatC [candidate division KSB1 bacterium]MCB9502670.1 twin-arginine translocase subunit TatC [Deferribacteres bacterium]
MPEENKESKQNKNSSAEMPFLQHLEELRWRLIRSVVAILAGAIVAFFFADQILHFLQVPFDAAVKMYSESSGANTVERAKLIYLAPTEGFMIQIKVSIFAGLIFTLPYIFYQIWQFVAPGLLEKEKRIVPKIIGASTFFFLLGAFFCWAVVLRFGLAFLLGFQSESLQATITINEYMSFVLLLILTFGLVFELPILAFFLTKMGFLSSQGMRDKRSYSIVGIFIIAAVVTPPDVFTQMALAIPLLILYELSIFVSQFVEKKQKSDESESTAVV